MRSVPLLAFGLHFRGLVSQALDANNISLDEKVLAMERLLIGPGTIDFPVAPCERNLNSAPNNISGDQTAAQWVRTVFHDFATADVKAGTGGLDASIGFEADREENKGITILNTSFINETIRAFNLFSDVFISTADFIAVGLSASLTSCDSAKPLIKLRVGRIDATGPGPSGVPKPEDSLESATNAFAKAGFNKTEMIQAVACGHSIGSVHKVDFPEIVGDEPTTDTGGTGADTFDSTPFNFDNTQLQEYITGKGKRGGPLVTTKNVTMQSDLRIFTSDKNVTVKAMSSADSFRKTCLTIFEKMLNTVPKGVTLSDPVVIRPWITQESHLDLSSSGTLYFSGNITTNENALKNPPSTASYVYLTSSGSTVKSGTSEPARKFDMIIHDGILGEVLSAPFGQITGYSFNDTITKNVASIKIQNSYTEQINTALFVMPSRSFINTDNNGVKTYLVRAAVLTTTASSGGSMTGTLYRSSQQPNSLAPKFIRIPFTLTKEKTLGDYTIFKGQVKETGTLSVGGGRNTIDVQFGTMRSQKVIRLFQDPLSKENFFSPCSDLTKC